MNISESREKIIGYIAKNSNRSTKDVAAKFKITIEEAKKIRNDYKDEIKAIKEQAKSNASSTKEPVAFQPEVAIEQPDKDDIPVLPEDKNDGVAEMFEDDWLEMKGLKPWREFYQERLCALTGILQDAVKERCETPFTVIKELDALSLFYKEMRKYHDDL